MGPLKIFAYQNTLLQELDTTIKPLSSHLNIGTFGYRQFLPDGRSFGISTNKAWLRFYNENFAGTRIPNYEEEIKKTIEMGSFYSFRMGMPDPKDAFCVSLYDFGVWNTLCIYKKDRARVDGFYFSASKENDKFCTSFLNNLSFLNDYTSFFVEIFSSVADIEVIGKLALPTVSKESFIPSESNLLALKKKFSDSLWQFKSDLSSTEAHVDNAVPIKCFSEFTRKDLIKKLNKNGNKIGSLTARESEVLKGLAHGKRIKEIARDLKISPRTVESYIDNIKNKIGVSYNSQLVDFYHKFANPPLSIERKNKP